MDQTVYRFGDCTLDSANRRFTRGGTECDLEPKVFAVLVQLIARPAELVTREQLLDAVWGHRYVTSSTLNRVISLARRALADDADRPALIQTVHGAGYRYTGPVEQAAASAEPRARFGPPASARLPARLQALLGREHELSQIDALLRDGRSLTILGTGGMGKTQCALAFAHGQAERYPDGIWFFDLVPRDGRRNGCRRSRSPCPSRPRARPICSTKSPRRWRAGVRCCCWITAIGYPRISAL